MIQLKHFSKWLPETSSAIALVIDEKTSIDIALPKDVSKFKDNFLKSEEKFDFLKTPIGFYFLIKSNQKNDELRIAGSTIFTTLTKEVNTLYLYGESDALSYLGEGLLLSSYQFISFFKDSEKKKHALKSVLFPELFAQKKIDELANITAAVFWARDRVNEPVSHLNASQLSEHIAKLGEIAGFSVQVLEKTQIESLKMGGLLAVNKGSIDPPTFTIAEYKPKKASNKKPIVLVGKGVVYDTGGLSLKPTPGSMDVMKSDMAGAACVIGALYLAALQKLNTHIIALIPATDNRPGMQAYTPGDVITMYDGTTVEVLNTDAEGRMILADALAYSNKYNPELVIDAATLTGAALRAIGTKASIVMGNAAPNHFEILKKAGDLTHERVVQFPFWDDYLEEMKSSIADLKNLGGPNAGMITAGKFLEHFVKSPYIHMDIAGPAWLDSKENYKGQGGTGAGVRLLYTFLKLYNN
jgi:leucyl aminopeptidase